ncbi:hypothetical protein LPJ57_005035 [Coemansia sp. RSA 486]|nr:hypothetical protein LPJ57_005035 [Coemansia sp. RSA 486]
MYQQHSLDGSAASSEPALAHQAYPPITGFSQPLLLQSAFLPEAAHNPHMRLPAQHNEVPFPFHIPGHLDPNVSVVSGAASAGIGAEPGTFVHPSSEYILGPSMPGMDPSYRIDRVPAIPLDAVGAGIIYPHHGHVFQTDTMINPDQIPHAPQQYLAELYDLAQMHNHMYTSEQNQGHGQSSSSAKEPQPHSASSNTEHV